MTEHEVQAGILSTDDPSDHVLLFLRGYDGLDNSRLGDDDVHRHIDLCKDNEQVRIVRVGHTMIGYIRGPVNASSSALL